MGWWFGYILFIFLGIAIICYINKFDKKQTEMIALIVTIFGIFLSVSDEFCCQYDYEPNKIWTAILDDICNTNDMQITDLAGNDIVYQKIFFVLDVSQSTNTKIDINNKQKNELNNLIDKIKNSALGADLDRLPTQQISLSELLRIRLYSVLIDMQNSKSKFSIIQFDTNPKFLTIDKQFNDVNLKEAFGVINSVNFKGDETNFKILFDFLESKVNDKDNPFQKDKNTLVFLSDFIHDSKNSTDNNPDSIKAVLDRLDKKSVHFNMIGFSNISKPANFISIKEGIEKIFPERYKFIDALNETTVKLELSNHNCENPLHFYSKNRLHEKNLISNLTFKNTPNKDYRFRLKNNYNARQFYQIICGTDTSKLTETPVYKQLASGNKISILMTGHVVSQHFTPVLFVEDLSDNHSYSIGIVFLKELSKTSKILGSILIGMIIGFFSKNCIKNRWEKIKTILTQDTKIPLFKI
ncbi:MAG: hypothetical protein LBG92_06910 [Prevotellaceae bacterium]|jgi:hypothetical protein|nr:hypothetical protein [Prevotellaceae bacterium]